MHRRLTRTFGVLATAGIVAAIAPRRASADEKEVCVRAVERAQVARLDGKLRDAREGFVTCARAVCPDAIRQDCTRWVAEVDASLPSVVFDAVWADGRDVTGMTVTLDGKLVPGAERGRAVSVDPGEHTFRFEVPGAVAVETRNVVREGEKNRSLKVTFTPASPSPATTSTVPSDAAAPTTTPAPSALGTRPSSTAAPERLWAPIPEASPASSSSGHVPLATWVLGGVALASLGGFAALGLDGLHRLDAMRGSCGHTCSASDVNGARTELLVGDVVGIVGLVAGAAAVWLWLGQPSETATSASNR